MKSFVRLLKADFLKIRHTPMLWIHMIVPASIAILLLIYYAFSHQIALGKVAGLMELLGVGFPLVIGIITAMAIDQEASAGHFGEILMARGKIKCFLSKLCMLLLMALGSLLIAIGGFALGFQFILHQNQFSVSFYGQLIIVLFLSQIFLYLLHTICSLRFGTGASIGLGIAESLIAALMITGLGEGIWHWIPCSWGVRFNVYNLSLLAHSGVSQCIKELISGGTICFMATILLFVFSLIWFHYFEGRSEN